MQSTLESSRRGGPSPVDEDKLDLHQAFLDIALHLGESRTLTLRGGRQEMSYGSARLIDVRQGPDVRRSFDGARVLLQWHDWKIDGVVARPVRNKAEVFGNRTDNTQALWGILTTIYAHFFPGSFLRETGSAKPIDFIELTLSFTF